MSMTTDTKQLNFHTTPPMTVFSYFSIFDGSYSFDLFRTLCSIEVLASGHFVPLGLLKMYITLPFQSASCETQATGSLQDGRSVTGDIGPHKTGGL